MSQETRIRAGVSEGITEVRLLMSHPMETGQRQSRDGKPMPAHYITDVTVKHEGRIVLSAKTGPSVSTNPYLSFRFKGGASGESIEVSWVDNLGETRSDTAQIR